MKGVEKSNDHIVAGKLLELNPAREIAVNREFEALRRLRHERIAQLLEAYRAPGAEVAVLIMEKLQGADVLTYFSSRHEYNEQMVCNVITQVSFSLGVYLLFLISIEFAGIFFAHDTTKNACEITGHRCPAVSALARTVSLRFAT